MRIIVIMLFCYHETLKLIILIKNNCCIKLILFLILFYIEFRLFDTFVHVLEKEFSKFVYSSKTF